ncbi:MAG TPA: hypothetical protein VGA21_13295 [Cyclobacteriaceae bacterium]
MQILSRRIHNGYWIASLVILSGLTFFVYTSGERSGENFDENKFTLEVNSIITSVDISSPGVNLNFEFLEGEWIVNDSFRMDPGMRDAFFTVISSIKVKKPAGINQKDSLINFLKTSGSKVRIINNQNLIKSYLVGGDELSGVSYFMDSDDEAPYEVILPGYKSYVAGIYSVPLKDWRNRFLFELDWSSLKSILVEYINNESPGFSVNYKEDFFYLNNNSQPIDSAVIFDYIGELMNLQAERFLLPEEDLAYDSLAASLPLAKVVLVTIGSNDQVLEVFPTIKERRLTLARYNGELLVLFNPRSLGPVLIHNEHWE